MGFPSTVLQKKLVLPDGRREVVDHVGAPKECERAEGEKESVVVSCALVLKMGDGMTA